MKIAFIPMLFTSLSSFVHGQGIYSETKSNGVVIQNSFPRGGPYTGPVEKYASVSNLIFYSRVINNREQSIEVTVNFMADPIAIPNLPDTFMKLFLPSGTMTLEKRSLFNYGVKDLESFDNATSFQRKLNSGEDCLFNLVAVFYKTKADERNERGGNRAEFVLKGQDLFYRMPPQVELLHCGRITFDP